MAKAKQETVEKVLSELKIPKVEAEQKLKERIEKGTEFINNNSSIYDDLEKLFDKWDDFNNELLKRIFTTDEYQNSYMWSGDNIIAYSSFSGEPSYHEKIAKLKKDIQDKNHYLETLIEKLELIPMLKIISEDKIPMMNSDSKKAFIVHGRDEVSKTNLEILLKEMGLEPIVLHRQADEGQTVIEKFEKYGSDVAYAFILLTPDEIAYLSNEDSLSDEKRKKEKRARPNVIFEFGYFIGKLGRSRVCCLYTGDVTLPSDLSGFVYKKYNNSVEEVAWNIQKDLKVLGIL
jgi:predicted nucleotide-binding protein